MNGANGQSEKDFDELVALNSKFEQQLNELNKGKQSNTATSSSQKTPWYAPKRLLLAMFLLVTSILIPFIVLVRTSVYMYLGQGLNGWVALAVGVLATVVLLMGYALLGSYAFSKSLSVHRYLVRGVLVLVMAFTLYGLLYYSSMNTKTEMVGDYYRSLHPIMRVALTTITLADSDLVVTDIRREPADYDRMGLSENEQSLHYVQADGYVHAVDLRTRGRAEWKNLVRRAAFYVVGLSSIRHVGTADHLHIYLPLNE